MRDEEEELLAVKNSQLKFEKLPVFPGRPARYKMLVNGVYFGDVIAKRDKAQPKILGKHPMIYTIVNDPTECSTSDLGELVRRMYQLKRTEGWSPVEDMDENRTRTEA